MRFSRASPTGVIWIPLTPIRGLAASRSKKRRSGLSSRSERKRNSPLVSIEIRVISGKVQKRTAVTSSCEAAGQRKPADTNSDAEIKIRRMTSLMRTVVFSPIGVHGFFDDRNVDYRFHFGSRRLGSSLRFTGLA